MTDEKKQTLKTILICAGFAAGGFILATILNGSVGGGLGGLILGFLGLANRRGLRQAVDDSGKLRDGIEGSVGAAESISAGIAENQKSIADSIDGAEVAGKLAGNIDPARGRIEAALDGIGGAKKILEEAKHRADDKPGADR